MVRMYEGLILSTLFQINFRLSMASKPCTKSDTITYAHTTNTDGGKETDIMKCCYDPPVA